MNINDKIKQILIDKNISPSYFADEIGVARASISHILTGRNRPSFDIIQKIIRRFPDLGYDWIMEDEPTPQRGSNVGIGNANSGSAQQRPAPQMTNQQRPAPADLPMYNSARSGTMTNMREDFTPEPLPEPDLASSGPALANPDFGIEKTIERILIFYTDGTFREFLPAGV
jgi:transcriptional regulator with XRE-family HTH domain